MSFIDKIKERVTGFLSGQNSKYLLTESGLKLLIVDHEFKDPARASAGVWSGKSKAGAGSWDDKNKVS